MSEELGGPNGERADSELKELETLGGVLRLAVSRVGRVKGECPVPGDGNGAGPLHRHGDEVGLSDVGADLRERVLEVRLGHLFHAPLPGGFRT